MAALYEAIDAFDDWGFTTLVTTRAAGTFNASSDEPGRDVTARWDALRSRLFGHEGTGRLATAFQVHGARIICHAPGWEGWLRGAAADGHLSFDRGTAMAVSVADCVPVFVGHPSGAAAVLHSGWRGTEANIVGECIRRLTDAGHAASELRVVTGPAICGDCYEVSPDVYARLTGRAVNVPTTVDLRALIAGRAAALRVRDIRTSDGCTRCHNDRWFSHRAGDAGRQIGVILARP